MLYEVITVHVQGLHHGFGPELRVVFAVGAFDGVDRRAGQEQGIGDQATLFDILEVEPDVALIES